MKENTINQPVIKTIEIFSNPLYIPGIDYKMKNVALSVNSNDLTLDNRGTLFRNLYANNAYIDTRDLNLDFRDAIISNYAEFRNGNRAGTGGYTGDYRWTTVVDNDYRRLVSDIIPVTLQLYTQKTGSFSLEMGNLIVLVTQAPPVHYDPYEVTNVPQTENSFYRLTYKEDKIQKTTTTPEFKDIDKDTYKPTKRISMRFENQDTNISSNFDILDLSKGGAAVHNDGSLKLGDKFEVNIVYEDMSVKATAEVVRVGGNTAGVKFVNLDKATSNKLLYINMLASKHNKNNKISKL
jgi:hypothetical protein